MVEYVPLIIQLNFSSVNINQNLDDFKIRLIKAPTKFWCAKLNVLTLLELVLLS